MGMFDYFDCMVSCPICGNTVKSAFQTKDLRCEMDTYKPGDNVGTVGTPKFIIVYTTCDHALKKITLTSRNSEELVTAELHGVWIEYSIPITDGIIARDMNLWTRSSPIPVCYSSLSVIPPGYSMGMLISMAIKENRKIGKDILTTKWEQTHNKK